MCERYGENATSQDARRAFAWAASSRQAPAGSRPPFGQPPGPQGLRPGRPRFPRRSHRLALPTVEQRDTPDRRRRLGEGSRGLSRRRRPESPGLRRPGPSTPSRWRDACCSGRSRRCRVGRRPPCGPRHGGRYRRGCQVRDDLLGCKARLCRRCRTEVANLLEILGDVLGRGGHLPCFNGLNGGP
jgi:hypothetical protein